VPPSNVCRLRLITGIAILLESVAVGAASPMTLVIHVIDYAQVEPFDLVRTQHDVARMFGSIGVTTNWRQERSSSADLDNTGDVTVVILSRSMSERMFAVDHLAKGVLGRAVPSCRRAWLYFDEIEKGAVDHNVGVATLLSRVISHEVGHMVGNLPHADRGTMRPVLDLAPGRFQGFTNAEGQQIRATLSERSVERGRVSELATPHSVP